MVLIKELVSTFNKRLSSIFAYFTYLFNFLKINKVSSELDLNIFTCKNILIVTAHPDDEIFCLAHFIDALARVNCKISWINTTLGQNSINSTIYKSTERTSVIRLKEFEESAKYLGIFNIIHLKIPSYLNKEIDNIYLEPVKNWIEECDFLFLIGKNDKHPDHFYTTKTFEKFKDRGRIYYYNVQRVSYEKGKTYFWTKFDLQLYNDLVKIYCSQSHMKRSFEVYRLIFKKKVFIYNESIN